MTSDTKLKNARIPKRFWGLTVDYYAKQGQPSVADSLLDYTAYLSEHRSEGLGLLLVGPAGTGKTLCASAVLQAAMAEGFTALFVTMPQLINMQHRIRDLRDAWGSMKDEIAYADWVRKTEAMDSLRNEIDFVVIDDVGKEHSTTSGYTQAVFDDVFRTRYDNSLPTIITTNVAPQQWEGRYSPAMADFIKEACVPIEMAEGSFRSGKLHGEG